LNLSRRPTPDLIEKARFLSVPASYAHAPQQVTVVETHMSLVFLAGDRAYKLKKAVRFDFLDFSTLAAREAACREELRLNRRLAESVYLDVAPLTLAPSGGLAIAGQGEVVDWLVVMRRLPEERMLDRLLCDGAAGHAEIAQLAETLAAFYRRAAVSAIHPGDYAARFFREQAKNREILTSRNFALDHGRAAQTLDRLDARLLVERPRLEARARAGRIVEGHGDLRPEHVCFVHPIAIFDCLEFNADLRQVDPFDELAFLGVECAQLGARGFGPQLIEAVSRLLGAAPPPSLLALYAAWRAMLRARLAVAHLLDAAPRTPAKWEPLATRYLILAEEALAR
jgi:uncharacterized protein